MHRDRLSIVCQLSEPSLHPDGVRINTPEPNRREPKEAGHQPRLIPNAALPLLLPACQPRFRFPPDVSSLGRHGGTSGASCGRRRGVKVDELSCSSVVLFSSCSVLARFRTTLSNPHPSRSPSETCSRSSRYHIVVVAVLMWHDFFPSGVRHAVPSS